MRTYGRNGYNPAINGFNWVEVTTDSNGFNDEVNLVTLCDVLGLELRESPFYGNFGIPAEQSVIQQTFPNYYVSLTAQYFAQFFASLRVSQATQLDEDGVPEPVYQINIITNQGAILTATIPQ